MSLTSTGQDSPSRLLRASDGERERVAAKLEREFAAGRLSTAELEQRAVLAQAARTRAQLRELTADLPADPAPARAAASRPDHCLMCLLWCVCPPAGLAYWLISRRAIEPVDEN
jgi:hypothetical protein